MRVRCSSGTYIRALARDLGAALGTGGHLTALRRTAVGPYDIAQARTLEELEDHNQDDPERGRLAPLARAVIPLAEAAAAAFPRLDLTADEARRLAQGARLPLPAGSRPLPRSPPSTPTAPWSAWSPGGRAAPLARRLRRRRGRGQSPMMRRIRTQLSRTGPHSRSAAAVL